MCISLRAPNVPAPCTPPTPERAQHHSLSSLTTLLSSDLDRGPSGTLGTLRPAPRPRASPSISCSRLGLLLPQFWSGSVTRTVDPSAAKPHRSAATPTRRRPFSFSLGPPSIARFGWTRLGTARSGGTRFEPDPSPGSIRRSGIPGRASGWEERGTNGSDKAPRAPAPQPSVDVLGFIGCRSGPTIATERGQTRAGAPPPAVSAPNGRVNWTTGLAHASERAVQR